MYKGYFIQTGLGFCSDFDSLKSARSMTFLLIASRSHVHPCWLQGFFRAALNEILGFVRHSSTQMKWLAEDLVKSVS